MRVKVLDQITRRQIAFHEVGITKRRLQCEAAELLACLGDHLHILETAADDIEELVDGGAHHLVHRGRVDHIFRDQATSLFDESGGQLRMGVCLQERESSEEDSGCCVVNNCEDLGGGIK